jgi:hypothetical protein
VCVFVLNLFQPHVSHHIRKVSEAEREKEREKRKNAINVGHLVL